ncbi:MAG: hypothetical protein ABJC62_10415 [Frankiaceae bacterium]
MKGNDMRYVLPGQPGSRVKLELRYESFIRDKPLAPAEVDCRVDRSIPTGGATADCVPSSLADVQRTVDADPAVKDASGDASVAAHAEVLGA